MKINQKLIKETIHATEAEIRQFKKSRSLPPGGWPGYAEMAARDYATQLYSIQAHRRGRIHLGKKFATLAEQDDFIRYTRVNFIIPGSQDLTSAISVEQSVVAAQ